MRKGFLIAAVAAAGVIASVSWYADSVTSSLVSGSLHIFNVGKAIVMFTPYHAAARMNLPAPRDTASPATTRCELPGKPKLGQLQPVAATDLCRPAATEGPEEVIQVEDIPQNIARAIEDALELDTLKVQMPDLGEVEVGPAEVVLTSFEAEVAEAGCCAECEPQAPATKCPGKFVCPIRCQGCPAACRIACESECKCENCPCEQCACESSKTDSCACKGCSKSAGGSCKTGSCATACSKCCDQPCKTCCEKECSKCCEQECKTCCQEACGKCCTQKCGTCCEQKCGTCCADACKTCEQKCGTCCEQKCGTCCQEACGKCCPQECGTCCQGKCPVGCGTGSACCPSFFKIIAKFFAVKKEGCDAGETPAAAEEQEDVPGESEPVNQSTPDSSHYYHHGGCPYMGGCPYHCPSYHPVVIPHQTDYRHYDETKPVQGEQEDAELEQEIDQVRHEPLRKAILLWDRDVKVRPFVDTLEFRPGVDGDLSSIGTAY